MSSRHSATPDDAAIEAAHRLIYLYGVVAAGSEAVGMLAERWVPGVQPGSPLFPIEAAGLVAAVSDVPAAVFDEEPLNALVTDLPRLTEYAVRHEQAIRALLGSALVPMSFGAVYRSPGRVAALLAERAEELRTLLDRLEGRQEWGLKVIADTPAVLEAAERESEELRRLADQAAAATPGRAYLIDRRRDQLRAREAARLAADTLAAIMASLGRLAAASVQDDPGPPQPGATERLALRAAFLVDRAAAESFVQTAACLSESTAPRGFRLEVSGPWAPYSFVRNAGAGDE